MCLKKNGSPPFNHELRLFITNCVNNVKYLIEKKNKNPFFSPTSYLLIHFLSLKCHKCYKARWIFEDHKDYYFAAVFFPPQDKLQLDNQTVKT